MASCGRVHDHTVRNTYLLERRFGFNARETFPAVRDAGIRKQVAPVDDRRAALLVGGTCPPCAVIEIHCKQMNFLVAHIIRFASGSYDSTAFPIGRLAYRRLHCRLCVLLAYCRQLRGGSDQRAQPACTGSESLPEGRI